MAHTTVALFRSRADAEKALGELKSLGVPDSEISYVYVTEEGGSTVVADGGGAVSKETSGETVADGAAGGAATGAVVGALAGLVVATGVLPGLGALFVAGPLATALGLTGAAATTAAGAMTGAAAGGLIGALVGFGATEEEAKIYENRVKQGDILVATSSDIDGVKDVLASNSADEVREYVK